MLFILPVRTLFGSIARNSSVGEELSEGFSHFVIVAHLQCFSLSSLLVTKYVGFVAIVIVIVIVTVTVRCYFVIITDPITAKNVFIFFV